MKRKRVLNVGGNNKGILLPAHYSMFEHVLLDIDPTLSPDIVCDARRLTDLASDQFDAVYCSHNLEHYYRHDLPLVLDGFLHVLKTGGFAQIRVPDIAEVMRITIDRGLDVSDVLYYSAVGPITVLDVLYGYGAEIERTREDFFAHKNGFTEQYLRTVLVGSGFAETYTLLGNLEINAVAFKGNPDAEIKRLLGLPEAT